MPSFSLHNADCLDFLKTMDDCSIDSIVTDPPYGLSQPGKGNARSLGSAMLEVVLPDLADLYAKRFGDTDLPFPRDSVLYLDWALRSIGIEPGVGVPKSSINLKSDIVIGQEKIKAARKGSIGVPDGVLMDKSDAISNELLGEYILGFRPLGYSAFSDCDCIGLRQLGPSRFSMPVVISSDSSLVCFLSGELLSSTATLADTVRFNNDALAQPDTSSPVMTGDATELVVVFTFDLAAGTCKVSPASGADELNLIAQLVSAKNVTTSATACSLPSMFKAHTIRFIDGTTDGTLTINFHKDLLACLNSSKGGFMGKAWDYDVPSVDIWKECLRVLKPGGHLLAFAGTRTQHRMAVNIEDAGFDIRDLVMWHYGSGFPKSHDVSKAIDKAAGAEREVIREATPPPANFKSGTFDNRGPNSFGNGAITTPATPEAQRWEGWGSALKPATEIVTLARKPFKGTLAANVLEHGTGAINVDGCRVEHVTVGDGNLALNPHLRSHINGGNGGNIIAHEDERRVVKPHASGRWPANLIHDGSDEVMELFPQSNGQQGAISGKEPSGKTSNVFGEYAGRNESQPRNDSGSAARFFYSPKVSKKERGEDNNHPTVKPITLMAYLCRLVTPPNGTVLDPFMGSGSTGIAALQEGFSFVGVEREPEYLAIAEKRIQNSLKGSMLR